ncbi:hypothetical protein [Thalassospira alkalitolerans]|uniref:hypothetical protein n=1 Tax=Thalassospira alkalitolerans TaxID=1293890 RepID=UPI003AA83380
MNAVHHQVQMMNAFVVGTDKVGEINRCDFIRISAKVWFLINASTAVIRFQPKITQKRERTRQPRQQKSSCR